MGEVGAPSCGYTGADECVLRHAVRMLDRLGDRAGASQMYDEFTRPWGKRSTLNHRRNFGVDRGAETPV